MKAINFAAIVCAIVIIACWSNCGLAAGNYPIPKEDQFATYKLDLNGDGKLETITTFRRAVGWFEQNGKRASNFEVAIRITQPAEEGKPSRITIYQTSFTKIPNSKLGEGGVFSARLVHPYYPDFEDLHQGPFPTFAWEISGRKGLCVGVQITGGYVHDIETETFDQNWSYVPIFFTFTDGAYKLQYSHPNDQAVIEKFRGYATERFSNRIQLDLIHKNAPVSQLVMVNKDKAKAKAAELKTNKSEQKKTETKAKDSKAKKEVKVEAKPKDAKKVEEKKPADKKPETKPDSKPEDKENKDKEQPKEDNQEAPKEPEKPAPNPDDNKEPENKTENTEGN